MKKRIFSMLLIAICTIALLMTVVSAGDNASTAGEVDTLDELNTATNSNDSVSNKLTNDIPGSDTTIPEGRSGTYNEKSGMFNLDNVDAHSHRICGAENCSHDGHDDAVEWKPLSEIPNNLEESGHYYLTNDTTLNRSKMIYADITLCLNGYTINVGGGYNYIMISGQCDFFNLCDCGGKDNRIGKITGLNHTGISGLQFTGDTVFNMYGGSITGNNGPSAGGMYLMDPGVTFNMYGGSITGNTGKDGDYSTGGVYVNSGATFNLYGGSITGNTLRESGKAANVYLYSDCKINVVGTLSEDASIGVTVMDPSDGRVITVGGAGQIDKFHSDNAGYEIVAVGDDLALKAIYGPTDPDGDGIYEDDEKNTYIPAPDGNGFIEVKPNEDGSYSDDANSDSEFGGDEDTTYIPDPENPGKFIEGTWAARIGNTYYATLKAANKAVKENETIVMLRNESFNASYLTTKIDFTIDLNGYTISADPAHSTYPYTLVVSKGTLTITDSSDTQMGTISGVKTMYVYPNANVVMEAGNISATGTFAVYLSGSSFTMENGSVNSSAGAGFAMDSSGESQATLVIRDGSVTASSAAILANGSTGKDNCHATIEDGTITSTDDIAIYWPSNGKLSIDGGNITGTTAIYLRAGSLEITNGIIRGNGEKADYAYRGSGADSTGDAVVIENVGGGTGYEEIASVSITDGKFISENADAVGSYTAGHEGVEAVTNFIYGGSYSDNRTILNLANDYVYGEYYDNESGRTMYGVEPSYSVTFVVPEGATLVVMGADGNEIEAESDGSYMLIDGNYTYAVSKLEYTTKNGSFTVNGAGMIITVSLEEDKPDSQIIIPKYFHITINSSVNGDVTANKKGASAGTKITLAVDPDDGYVLDMLTVIDRYGNEITVTANSNGTYTFIMPSKDIWVTATFVEKAETPDVPSDSCNGGISCPMFFYEDVDTSLWYHDGIHFCIENGLMGSNSTSKLIFAPNATTTRAMIVTILWRLENSPVVNYLMDFEDVEADQWYTEAIRWAASEKIVEGHGNGKFGTNDPITREQLATVMWRYAKYKDYDVSVGENTNILSYGDAFDVSEYAIPAMQWACGSGLIQGIVDDNAMNLKPQGNATRAQAATILYRFCENVANKH